jgi:hypothetical protein
MTKTDNATQGMFTKLSSGYQAALMTHVMPTTLQATDWETFLVRTSVIATIVTFLAVFFIV